VFHNLAVPLLHLFIWIVKFLSLYVDELNDDDDDDDRCWFFFILLSNNGQHDTNYMRGNLAIELG